MGCDYYIITELEITYLDGNVNTIVIDTTPHYYLNGNDDSDKYFTKKIVYENGKWTINSPNDIYEYNLAVKSVNREKKKILKIIRITSCVDR